MAGPFCIAISLYGRLISRALIGQFDVRNLWYGLGYGPLKLLCLLNIKKKKKKRFSLSAMRGKEIFQQKKIVKKLTTDATENAEFLNYV